MEPTKTTKETRKDKTAKSFEEYKLRWAFLEVYNDLNRWLAAVGFKSKMSSTEQDYHYSYYDEHIDSMHSVECYVLEPVKLVIRFMRDRNEHKLMFVAGMVGRSEVMDIDAFKEAILKNVRDLRDEKLKELEPLMTL